MSSSVFKDVFISYGRKESLAFAAKLFNNLEGAGFSTWFDHVNIPKGDDFQRRIDDGIRSANNFIYIIAPHANASEFCLKEVELALTLGKRIIPILHIERDLEKIHSEIGARNWIYSREKESNTLPLEEWEPIDDFDKAFKDVTTLLNKEKEYVAKHTEILWNALEWESHQKQTQYLLVGKKRQESEEWLLTEFTPPKQPPCKPTDLHCEYICEARKNAENLMTDVFICYDTEDKGIRNNVINSLARHAITTWIHDRDIEQGVEYARAIDEGIENADNFLFFISPESLQSEYCQKEIKHALKMNKRILPLLVKEVSQQEVADFQTQVNLDITSLQYIDFTDNKVQADYDSDIDQVLNVLRKDQEYFEQHKVLLARAISWENSGRKNTLLLRGFNLDNASTWFNLNEGRKQYAPVEQHKTLIKSSQAAKGSLGTEVFISYSRRDSDFARRLNRSLQDAGKTTWFDQESISSGVDFEKEIYKGIDGSSNIVFVLSPDSVQSEYCEREVLYAAEQNKRFIPLLLRETQPESMPEPLRVINWIDFTGAKNDSRLYDKSFSSFIQALELDKEHAHRHTVLQQRSAEWDENDKSTDYLLNASACANAVIWLEEAKGKTPEVTSLQKAFIEGSKAAIEEAEIKEKKVAQTLKRRLRITRYLGAASILSFIVAAMLALNSRQNADDLRALDQQNQQLIEQTQEALDKAKLQAQETEIARREIDDLYLKLKVYIEKQADVWLNKVEPSLSAANYEAAIINLDSAAKFPINKDIIAKHYAEIGFVYAHHPEESRKAANILKKAYDVLHGAVSSEADILVLPAILDSANFGLSQAVSVIKQLESIELEGGITTLKNILSSLEEKYYGKMILVNNDNSDFEIGSYEVTVAQYRLYCFATNKRMPQKPKWGWQEDHPITYVSWYDAIEYCNWLSQQKNLKSYYAIKGRNVSISDSMTITYRLPTEKEWETAAFGGQQQLTFSGSNNINDVAWYNNSSARPNSVGKKKANSLGIYDMSGNVREWCWDIKEQNFRTIRGGSWRTSASMCKVSADYYGGAMNKKDDNGFRVVRTIK